MCKSSDFLVLDAFDDAAVQLALDLVLANSVHEQVRHALGTLALPDPREHFCKTPCGAFVMLNRDEHRNPYLGPHQP
jgi:hypothetical protein